jgi:hypothetical protein
MAPNQDWLDFLDEEELEAPKPEAGPYVALADGDLSSKWDLGEFLHRLGGVFLLGKKDYKDPEYLYIPNFYLRILNIAAVVVWGPDRPKPVLTKAQLRRRRIWSYSLAASSLAAFAALMVSIVPTRSEALPSDLVGVWQTSAVGYADRTFEIAEDALVFQVGEGETDFQIQPITRVRRRGRAEDASLIQIQYGSEEAPLELAFYYEPGPEPLLRFQNQAELVWKPRR